MAETAERLRRSLAALRLERGGPAGRPRRRRWVWAAAGVALLVLVAGGVRLRHGRAAAVEVAQASVPEAGPGGEASVPILSGAGYVVSADRYIAIGVRVAGRIDRYMVEEGDHVQAGDPLVQLDPRDYEATVRHAEANLRQARATAALRETQLGRRASWPGPASSRATTSTSARPRRRRRAPRSARPRPSSRRPASRSSTRRSAPRAAASSWPSSRRWARSPCRAASPARAT